MSTLERAIMIAAENHTGAVDKAGQPYILHPLRLMLAVRTPEERIAAVLHDVVEDTTVTFEQLENEGFAPEVIEAVRALTKKSGETRPDSARRARANPIARAVKLADVADNMDLGRIAEPGPKDFARLAEYEHVREILLAGDRA
jgi:guanosine-3',5'-bis(diphosphate) 3'-pyrophosphohydrolase